MIKKLITVLLSLCVLFSLAACGSAPAHESESKPADWDMEAEVLRFLNGYTMAKTVEDLRPYALSENSDSLMEEYITQTNKLLEESWQNSDVRLDYRDYPFDSVTVTVLDTYKGYEIVWVNATGIVFAQAWEDLSEKGGALNVVFPGNVFLLALTVENGHYVTSFDERLLKEVRSKYDYCESCHSSGYEMSIESPCAECNGLGRFINCVCNDCGESFQEQPLSISPGGLGSVGDVDTSDEETTASIQASNVPVVGIGDMVYLTHYTCPSCESENVTVTEESCSSCVGEGFMLVEPEKCRTCDGNGWIKK